MTTAITDLGITYDGLSEENYVAERTLIVCTEYEGIKITGAVMLDPDGAIVEADIPFEAGGAHNYEMACRIASAEHGKNDSWACLARLRFEEVALAYAEKNPI